MFVFVDWHRLQWTVENLVQSYERPGREGKSALQHSYSSIANIKVIMDIKNRNRVKDATGLKSHIVTGPLTSAAVPGAGSLCIQFKWSWSAYGCRVGDTQALHDFLTKRDRFGRWPTNRWHWPAVMADWHCGQPCFPRDWCCASLVGQANYTRWWWKVGWICVPLETHCEINTLWPTLEVVYIWLPRHSS